METRGFMDAETALEEMRAKKILVFVRAPKQRVVLAYDSAMLRAYVEDGLIVLNDRVVVDDNKFPCYPGIFDCDQERGIYYYSYLEKLDEIRVYPRFKVLELIKGIDRDVLVIERSDGVRFKVEASITGLVVYNIAVNPGVTLGDLIVLVAIILAQENPEELRLEIERDQLRIPNSIAQVIGFLAYEAELVDLEFK